MNSLFNISQLRGAHVQDFLFENLKQVKDSVITTKSIEVISQMIFSATKVLTDYKFVFLGCFSACFIALSFFGLYASGQTQSLQTTQAVQPEKNAKLEEPSNVKMEMFRILGEDQYILKFLSNAKVINFFNEQRQRIDQENIKIGAKLTELSNKFPLDKQVNVVQKLYRDLVDRNSKPMDSQEIVFPFLYCGIGDFSFFEGSDLNIIHNLQVGLFKNYITRVVLQGWGNEVDIDLQFFCSRSSDPLFSKVIGPFLDQLDKKGLGRYDIFLEYETHSLDYETQSPMEVFSSQERNDLREIFDSYRPSIQVDELDYGVSDSESCSTFEYPDEGINELKGSDSLGFKAMKEIAEKHVDHSVFFSREMIVELFFKVLMEEFPDKSEYFCEVLKAGTSA